MRRKLDKRSKNFTAKRHGISAKATLRYALLNQQCNSANKTPNVEGAAVFKAQSKGSSIVSCLAVTFPRGKLSPVYFLHLYEEHEEEFL